jgi:hypothetical protein
MKAYLITTGILFAALAALHVWVVLQRGPALATDPWPAIVLVVAGAMSVWAGKLFYSASKGER